MTTSAVAAKIIEFSQAIDTLLTERAIEKMGNTVEYYQQHFKRNFTVKLVDSIEIDPISFRAEVVCTLRLSSDVTNEHGIKFTGDEATELRQLWVAATYQFGEKFYLDLHEAEHPGTKMYNPNYNPITSFELAEVASK